jgi:dynein heavy chain
MPVLGNPLNQIGWSDLVSKDLMDKFHNFMAHTYVTLGQVKGRTLLPLPPSDVTSSDKTSSKDKAHILEITSSLVLLERILSSSNSCRL